jgi:hypothetical protein
MPVNPLPCKYSRSRLLGLSTGAGVGNGEGPTEVEEVMKRRKAGTSKRSPLGPQEIAGGWGLGSWSQAGGNGNGAFLKV